jgi:drug/metabolite transporter (DMT)-like permease
MVAGRRQASSADLLLLSASVLWGLNYSIIKFGLAEIEPLAFPILRFGVGGFLLLIVLRLREGSIGVRLRDFPLLALVGLFGITLSQSSFVLALTNTSVSDTALLGATSPVITTILAVMVGLETARRRHWIAAVIGFGGVALITAGGTSGLRLGASLLGDGLALINAFCFSVSWLPIQPLLRRYSALRILTYEMLIGTVCLFPFAVPSLVAQQARVVSLPAWAALGYAIVMGSIITNLLFFTAIGRVGPSRAAIYQYLQAFLAVLFAVALLGEQVTAIQLLGGAVVVASVALSRSQGGHKPNRPEQLPPRIS